MRFSCEHPLRAGISITEARMLRRIANGRPVRDLSNSDAVVIGVVTNARLVTTTPPSAAMTFHADVTFSLYPRADAHRTPALRCCAVNAANWCSQVAIEFIEPVAIMGSRMVQKSLVAER